MSILLRELITVQWDKILVPFPNLKYIQWYLYYESRRMCILMCLYILSLIILLLILGFIVPPVHIHSEIFPPFPFFFLPSWFCTSLCICNAILFSTQLSFLFLSAFTCSMAQMQDVVCGLLRVYCFAVLGLHSLSVEGILISVKIISSGQ